MLTEEQLKSLNELALINPEVKILLDFYLEAQEDGVKTIRLSLNSQLIALSKEMEKKATNYDFTYDKIIEVSTVLKKLPKPPKPEKEVKDKKESGKFSNSKERAHAGKVIL